MPLSWKHCILGIWPIFCIFIICFIRRAFSVEPCQPPDRLYADVPENAAKGSRVLKINYKNGQIWKISGETPVGYFALEKGNTSFYLITKQIPDYEKLKEKGDNMAVDLECTSDQEIIPFHIAIFLKAVNEFTPTFTQRVYNRTISEDARKGDTVFIVSDVAKDQDYGDTLVFKALEIPRDRNGIVSPKFNMTDHVTGTIVLNGRLDYEKQKKYLIQIVASDRDGKNATAKLIVNVADVDDLGPVFIPNPCPSDDPLCQIPTFYHAQIMAADKGPITIYPNPVKAINTESDDYPISYSFSKGVPSNIENYFQINSRDATIQKLAELPENVTSSVKLFIKAEENSPLKHSSVSILVVHILDRNSTEIWSPTLKTKPSSDSIIEGYSSDVFYGVLIPLLVIVAILVLCIVVIFIKIKKTNFKNGVQNSKEGPTGTTFLANNGFTQTKTNLLSRSSSSATSRASAEMAENGISGVTNEAFVSDGSRSEPGEYASRASVGDNDIHPRSSLHSGIADEFSTRKLKPVGIYTATEDLRKAGVEDEEPAEDGDTDNTVYSSFNNKKNGAELPGSDASKTQTCFVDGPDQRRGSCAESMRGIGRAPDIPAPDYTLEDEQDLDESKEMTWVVPKANCQLESEISEFILTPDFIEQVGDKAAGSGGAKIREDVNRRNSGGTASSNASDSTRATETSQDKADDSDGDNTLPDWASEVLQPTIRPIASREEFKSHLESLMSSPPPMPQPLKMGLPSVETVSPARSLGNTPKKETTLPPTPPPLPRAAPPPPLLPPPTSPASSTPAGSPGPPSPSTAETRLKAPAAVPAQLPPAPPPLPLIETVATHL